jgi:hypothetical protein
MIDRWVENGLMDVLGEKGVGSIAFSPLEQGMLTDKYLKGIPADSRAAKDGRYLKPEQIGGEKLEMIKKLEVNYLCIKDFHLPLDSSVERIKAFHEQLAASNVTGYAVGPIYCKTREDMDKAFDYAKKVGVDLIVGIPLHEDLVDLDQKVKEYDIRFAIHNHGPEDKLYPNATVTVDLIKELDPRIGLCFDMGHNIRDGHDPIADLKKYKNRIFDIHLKNVTAAAAEGKVLRYIGEIDQGKCKVSVKALDSNHPLAKVKDGENALAIHTRYYQPIPFVLRGYGAGAAVTAAGVFGDVMRTLGWQQEM